MYRNIGNKNEEYAQLGCRMDGSISAYARLPLYPGKCYLVRTLLVVLQYLYSLLLLHHADGCAAATILIISMAYDCMSQQLEQPINLLRWTMEAFFIHFLSRTPDLPYTLQPALSAN